MALTYDDITAVVQKHIVPRLVDNVYKSSPVFTRLRTRNAERFEGGLSIRHPISYAELNGSAFTRGATFNRSLLKSNRISYRGHLAIGGYPDQAGRFWGRAGAETN